MSGYEQVHIDHPYTNPGDGRPQCPTCGKFVWAVLHSCKGLRMAAPDPTSPPWPNGNKRKRR